jgi:Uma2 family endonuclease
MNVALRKPMTQAEFLDWVQNQDGRYEFDGFQPVGMVGGTVAHGTIADNIRALLKQRLRGGPCRSIGSDGAAVQTIGTRLRYPEATVTCSPLANTDRIITNPVIVFEVISESTRRIDQVLKLREYHAVSTLKRYVLVEQTGVALTVHSRQHDEPWSTIPLGAGDVVDLPEIGIDIPVDDIFEGLTFSEDHGI